MNHPRATTTRRATEGADDPTLDDLSAELATLRIQQQTLLQRLRRREEQLALEERLVPDAAAIVTRTKYPEDSPRHCDGSPKANRRTPRSPYHTPPTMEDQRTLDAVDFLISVLGQPGNRVRINPGVERQILQALDDTAEYQRPTPPPKLTSDTSSMSRRRRTARCNPYPRCQSPEQPRRLHQTTTREKTTPTQNGADGKGHSCRLAPSRR